MTTPPATIDKAQAATRQIRAALALKRRYEILRGGVLSISALRDNPALLKAFRSDVAALGDQELNRLVAAAFDEGWADAPATIPARSAGASPDPAQASPGVSISSAQAVRSRHSRMWRLLAGAVALVLLLVLAQLGRLSGGGGIPLLTAADTALAHPLLRLQGSNTIGEKLAPMLVEGYLSAEGDTDIKRLDGREPAERHVLAHRAKTDATVAVQIVAHGSATAFTALEGGSADIGMSSRPINAAELERLAPKLGDLTQTGTENVVGLDGIAVIVNPLNRVSTLTVEQVARIFAGEIRTWEPLGGAARPIRVLARDEKSGTWDTFENLVLKRYKLKLGTAERLESSSELSDTVAQDADAIGFIGLPYVRSARALAIADERGSQALQPTAFTVATEDYPLSRRLFLYTPRAAPTAAGALEAARFVDFALSPRGQEIVQQAGFVPQRAAPEPVIAPADAPSAYLSVSARAQRLSLTFRFRPSSDELDNKALRDLDRVMAFLHTESGARLILLGFADATGTNEQNLKLSLDRARNVQAALAARGVDVAELVPLGAALPLAANDTALGRQKNRRVEIWVQR